jgi:molybdopterin-containing oxidoreductase family iron-sulfur binding subunit
MVRVKASNAASIDLPALVQPGQHDRVLAVALGYGVHGTERFADIGPQWLEARPTVEKGELVGKNAAPWLEFRDGAIQLSRPHVTLEKIPGRRELASTQGHHSLEIPRNVAPSGAEVRDIVQHTTLPAFANDPHAGTPESHHQVDVQLWAEDHPKQGHHWGMAVDLNCCTGCSACLIACQSENNVPVVGKDEVRRQREMHWIRIDRYYSGEDDDLNVAHQPMMCQHCDNAPCETVCPVLATVHGEEGLNEQAYNRCVGTRYCANNCPYKVRRFNWFKYEHEDSLQNLVLNPDVTVRSRGVMEKCSMCVQRIQDGKLEARRLGHPLVDGAIQTACQQSCPAQAIIFGDMNDANSRVNGALESPRRYAVLEEFNFRPSVSYERLVRNRDDKSEQPKQREGDRHA